MTPREIAERASKVSGGIPADFIYAQMAHETGGFTSRLAKEDFNYGGVTTTTMTEGMELPENPNGNVNYKHFNSDEEFADYYGRYLALYKEDGIFDAKTIEEYVAALKHGQYFTGDETEYVNGMKHFAGQEGGTYSPLYTATSAIHTDMNGAPLLEEDTTPVEREPSFFDKLLDPIENGWLGRPLRTFWMQTTTDFNYDSNSYEFTKEDVDKVNKLFPNDKASQDFIYAHANSPAQLEKVIQMQLESKAMERRIMESNYGFSTIGTALGVALTEALNPLNYLGVGLFTKGNLMLRLAKSAAFTATLNTADAAIREKLTGRQLELVDAAVMGAAMGALIPAFSHIALKGATPEIREAGEELAQRAKIKQAEADAALSGQPIPQPNSNVAWKSMAELHDKNYTTTHNSLANAIKNGKAIIVSRANIGVMRNILGKEIDKNAKAFHYKGKTVFIKEVLDKLTPEETTGLMRHELGVHGLSDDAMKSLLGWVETKVKKPTGLWRQALDKATASTPKGQKVDLEEVLGYWAELRGDSKGGYLTEVKNMLRKVTGDNSMTDEEVLEIIRGNMNRAVGAEETLARDEAVHFATNANVDPNKVERLANAEKPNTQEFGYNFMDNRATRYIGRKFEDSWFYGTPFGTMVNSKITSLNKLATSLFSDARMREQFAKNGMSAEDVLQYGQGQVAIPLAKFEDAFAKFGRKRYGIGERFFTKNLMELNEDIMTMHDYLFAGHNLPARISQMSAEDQQALKQLAQMYNNVEGVAPKLAKEFGYIGNQEYFKYLDKGTRRIVDTEKWRDFMVSYKGKDGTDEAFKDLEQYVYEACYTRWQANRDLLEALEKDKYDKALAAFQAGKTKTAPTKKTITNQDVDAFIRKEAHRAAYGYADQNTSNLTNGKDVGLYWMQHRVHMDTSYTKIMNGKEFSFDKDLRSYDLQHILGNTTRRWLGEIAVNHAVPDKLSYEKLIGGFKTVEGSIDNIKAVAEAEGRQLVEAGGMKQAELDRTLKIMNDSIDALRGISTRDRSWLDVSSDIMRRFSYGRVGGNMGLNQRMDFGNMMGYVGFRGITSILPNMFMGLSTKARNAYLRSTGVDVATTEAAVMKLMGDDLRRLELAKANLLNSRLGQEFYGGSVLDVVNNAANVFAEGGSQMNSLGGLTARMIRDSRLYTYLDLVKAAESFRLVQNTPNSTSYTIKDTFGMFGGRTPFSESKLRQAGINGKAAFFTNLKGYMKNGQIDFDTMFKQNKQLYYQCFKLIDNQAKRCIVEPTIGNSNVLANSNWFSRVLFQFKNFSFFANNSQFMRKATHMERDDIWSTIYELFVSAGITYGTIQATGWAKYKNDPIERKRFFDKRMDDFIWAGLTRSSTIGSPMSIATDVADTLGIKKSYRTTTGANRFNHKVSNPNEAFWKAVSQSPSLDTTSLIWDNIAGYSKRGVTKQNLKDTAGILVPANTNWKAQLVINNVVDCFNIPKK